MIFSIVIPTYNNAKFLKRALQSIKIQTSSNFEIIIIDNFSQDNTEEIIKNSGLKNLKYKKISNNGIIAKSRNYGLELSKGDWIHFLDSDDTLHKDKIKFLSENSINNYDLVCTGQKIVEEVTKKFKIWKFGPYEKNFYEKLLLQGNRFSTSASVIKREFLIKNKINFDERKEFVTAEDYDFFLNIVLKGAKVKFFDEILGEHYRHKNSQSSNYSLHKKSIQSVVRHHIFSVQKFDQNPHKLWKKLDWRFHLMDFLESVKNKKLILSAFILIKILINSPYQFANFFLLKLKKKYFIFTNN